MHRRDSVLVCSGCCNRMPQTRADTTDIDLSQSWRQGSPRSRWQQTQFLVRVCFLATYSRGGERKHPGVSSSSEDTHLFMTLSKPNYLLQGPPTNTIILRGRASIYELGSGAYTNIQSITDWHTHTHENYPCPKPSLVSNKSHLLPRRGKKLPTFQS